jgi:N-methylhydantoinase B
MFSATMGVGSVYHHRMAGGGGWGDPFLRDPEAVARDVLNEKVSIHAAEEQYGVVLTSGGAPDSELTDAARKALRSARHAG